MAGKFEITKAGDGTFSFELFIDDNAVGKSPVFDKEDACKRGVKAVKKNSRMKVQNTLANDEEKTNPKYLVEADGDKVKYTLFLQTGAVALEGSADNEAEALDIIEKIGNNANAAPMAMAEVVLSENEQKQIRIEKLKALQDSGRDPFEITLASQTHHSDEIKASYDELEGKDVIIAGRIMTWRDMGKANFIDIQDRNGRIQAYVRMNDIGEDAFKEFKTWDLGDIVEIKGFVFKTKTGEISVHAKEIRLLSKSLLPLPEKFHGLTDTDTRYRKRYLDMIMNPDVKETFIKRSKIITSIRNYLDNLGFIEVETPILIGSTPEGARDFVVPSRMNPGQFYALPQSPQTLKQLLMVAGFDRYFQIAKCFRDEDLRADRQPEFTQIDCEMSFVDQDDVINLFEEMARHLFKEIRGVELPKLEQMTWHDAMRRFGSDKPDLRFGMEFVELKDAFTGKGNFSVFDEAKYIGGICVPGCADYSRKQLNELTDFVKRPQVGAKGLVYIKYNADGTVKSSIDKFYSPEELAEIKTVMGAKDGDLVLILSGDNANKTRIQLCSLRLEMGDRLGLRDKNVFKCLWIIDFPLFEWSDEEQRLMATHHPFTMPNPDDIPLLDEHPELVRAKAYDFVCNGIEVGGGSLRIHDTQLQEKMFEVLGFTPERAEAQFGFLMNAFKYGAPPHAGLAFGLDRFVSIMAGLDSIRDCIAFPKNNSGRDVMLDAPSELDPKQLDELEIKLDLKAE